MKLKRFITTEEKDRIVELSTNKELIVDTRGYAYTYMDRALQEKNKDIINEISIILKDCIEGFVKFNNFTVDRRLRFQYQWSAGFTGVGYINIDELKEGFTKS